MPHGWGERATRLGRVPILPKEKDEWGRDRRGRYQRSGRNRRKGHSGSISARRLVPDVRRRRTAGEDGAMEGTAVPHYPVACRTDIRKTWTFSVSRDPSADAPGAHLRGTERSTRGERAPRAGGAASGGVAARGSRGAKVEVRGSGRAARYGEWGKSPWSALHLFRNLGAASVARFQLAPSDPFNNINQRTQERNVLTQSDRSTCTVYAILARAHTGRAA